MHTWDYPVRVRHNQHLIDAAIIITCLEFGCTPDQLISYSNPRTLARNIHDARKLIFFLMRDNLEMGVEEIGDVMHRDHSTVVQQLGKMSDLLLFKSEHRVKAKTCIDKFLSFQSKRQAA
jgi:chromosomal replication initiation ATPase DnaA